MTVNTCKVRLALAKSDEEKKFWEERIARKIRRFPNKYAAAPVKAAPKAEVKDVKKSKR